MTPDAYEAALIAVMDAWHCTRAQAEKLAEYLAHTEYEALAEITIEREIETER